MIATPAARGQGRFDHDELLLRRKECRTVNEWDSQYQLHSKPVGEVRLDPDRIREYNVQPGNSLRKPRLLYVAGPDADCRRRRLVGRGNRQG
ncbi:hypothetical protein LNQ52_20135 [Klebsiella pneumoniae subsp. pneumoniae]|nr:hypothetical protein [Klebsiella pneumoniae subsp. pneumoniae]